MIKEDLNIILKELGNCFSDLEILRSKTTFFATKRIMQESKQDDLLETLFQLFSEAGYSVLLTVGREKPYEDHGEYIIHPWKDSNGRHNKYDDETLLKTFEMDGYDPVSSEKGPVTTNENGKYVDAEGDLIFDEPNPEDYEIVMMHYLRT